MRTPGSTPAGPAPARRSAARRRPRPACRAGRRRRCAPPRRRPGGATCVHRAGRGGSRRPPWRPARRASPRSAGSRRCRWTARTARRCPRTCGSCSRIPAWSSSWASTPLAVAAPGQLGHPRQLLGLGGDHQLAGDLVRQVVLPAERHGLRAAGHREARLEPARGVVQPGVDHVGVVAGLVARPAAARARRRRPTGRCGPRRARWRGRRCRRRPRRRRSGGSVAVTAQCLDDGAGGVGPQHGAAGRGRGRGQRGRVDVSAR